MTCQECDEVCQRFGKHRNGLRRFRCPVCLKTYTEPHKPALEGSYRQLYICLILRFGVSWAMAVLRDRSQQSKGLRDGDALWLPRGHRRAETISDAQCVL